MKFLVVDLKPSMSPDLPSYYQEHEKERQYFDSRVGQHVSNCCGSSKAFNWQFMDQCSDTERVIAVEALQIRQRKPKIDTLDKYRWQELTLKY